MPGGPRVAVISERLWRNRFGARGDIINLPVTLNSQPFTIVGVMTIVARGGAGPTLPHAESTVGGVAREQYEFAGLGLHGASGVDVKIHRWLSAVVEYKLTYAKPEITIAGGSGSMTAITHHVAVGLAFGLSR